MAIKVRRGLDIDRLTVILDEGEVAYTTDTKMFYVGDGVTLGGVMIGPIPMGVTAWGSISGVLSAQTDLNSALAGKYSTSNPSGYITTAALVGYLTSAVASVTYYPLTNPSSYISGITGGMVTTALGYTPYDATNPTGYITSTALAPYLPISTAASTYQPIGAYLTSISGLNISLLINDSGYITSSALSGYLTSVTAALTYYPLTNPSGYISGITSGDVTTALGFTPYSNTNPSGFITSSALTGYLLSSTAASTYFPIPTGTSAQYITGAGTLTTFPTIPTVGTWGALNYPSWASGTPFVKMTAAGTFSLDTNSYLTSAITSLGTLTGATQTFGNDTNVTMVSSGTTHALTWSGTLADARIASASTWNAKQSAITTGLVSQYLRGDLSLASFPSIPSVGTWGALNYPAWATGSPFVKMTAAGTFALDTTTYLSSITSLNVTTALGFTPYNATNPSAYISGITSGMVTSALTYTPVDKAGDTMTGLLQFSGTTHAGLKLLSLTTVQRVALTPVAGMMVFDTDLATTCTYNGTNWEYTIKKIATLTTTAVIAAANITGLSFAVEANSTYEIDGYYLAGCSGVGGVKFAVTVPASTTFDALFDSVAATVATSVKARTVTSGSLTATASITAAAQGGVIVKGFIKVGVTAGTVQMQFASTTVAQTSTLYATSFCKLSKIA